MNPENDAALFEMLDEIISANLGDARNVSERRTSKRSSFQCEQLIAPQTAQELPSASQFVSIQCHDLSPQGFAFYSDEKPTYSRVVVALGNAPFILVLAQIRNVRRCFRDGKATHTIGCQFVRRIS